MSRIYFHSPSGDVELSGAERHHLAWYATHLTWPILAPYAERAFSGERDLPPQILSIISKESYLHNTPVESLERMDAIRTWYSVSMDEKGFFVLSEDGKSKTVELFALQLNTLWKLGTDPLKLAARIHGQCEIHAYVEGLNRAWLAGIMKKGRELNFYRAGMHWEEVINLLCARNDEPVVMSYSVCEQFPNARVAEWRVRNQARIDAAPSEEQDLLCDKIHDEFQNLSCKERWAMAMSHLRDGSAGAGLELKPDDWDNYCFHDGITCFDIAAYLDEQRDKELAQKKAANG